MSTWRVIRRSTSTGRTLKVLAECTTHREAMLFAEGFGRDDSGKTQIVVEIHG